jgi:hypothetical protein
MNTMQCNDFLYLHCAYERGKREREVNENNKTMQTMQARRNVFCEKVAAKNTEVAAKVIY